MADETKKYLDYDGLKHLVEKLTNKIEASGGGTDSHAVEVLKSVVTFPADPDYGTDGTRGSAGADDIQITDVITVTEEMDSLTLESDGGSFALIKPGMALLNAIDGYYISCTEKNTTGSDIHANLRLTVGFSDGEERTVNVIAVQRAAVAEDGVYAGYTDADGVSRIIAPEKWDESLGTLCGVAVVEGGRGMLVSPTGYTGWFGATVGDWGGARAEDAAQAICDTDGKTNTLLAYLKGAAEAENTMMSNVMAHHYGTVCAGRWFIGGLGQWQMVVRHYDDVCAAFSALGFSFSIPSYGVWSSTVADEGYMWCLNYYDGQFSYPTCYAGNDKLIKTPSAYPSAYPFAEWDFVL